MVRFKNSHPSSMYPNRIKIDLKFIFESGVWVTPSETEGPNEELKQSRLTTQTAFVHPSFHIEKHFVRNEWL